jgi:hypothetical protein
MGEGKMLHEVTPREVKGRDSIARFAAQFRAAAFMSLAILENDEIDCVFCDYHDDYVVRRRSSGQHFYEFYQVKTKEKSNYQWDLRDVYCLLKKGSQDPARIAESFAGKLLIHSVRFGNSCKTVTLQTNIQFRDEACQVSDALKDRDWGQKYAKTLFDRFREIFPEASELSDDEVADCLSKFRLEPGSPIVDIGCENFLALAKHAVYKYSEVELSYPEFVEIAEKLLALVQKKSLTKIVETDEKNLIDAAGITIFDLLDVLAISREGYRTLLEGGDTAALKSASILQRKLKEAGASEDMIQYFCQVKVGWDEWLRAKRHFIPEFELNDLMSRVLEAGKEWISSGGQVRALFEITRKFDVGDNDLLKAELNSDLKLGAILSEVVRNQE